MQKTGRLNISRDSEEKMTQDTLKNVSLEMTPKPFFQKDDEFVLSVLRGVFRDWDPLLRHSEQVSFLWWLSDGTDLLTYNRDFDTPIEWMFWLGFAHPTYDVAKEKDPGRDSITATPHIYRPDAIELTGADVRRIVGLIRQACHEVLGREVRVGMAFDPGCEFSNHPFRYRDHPELLMGDRMRCIDCTARLHADPRPFAGFPDGVPEGTPFGEFFGKQAKLYLEDMGFDYIWLSNSFGFGRSPYAFGGVGQFFDGETFRPEGNDAVRDDILEFWKLFRETCPDKEVECRGTDFSMGMNLVNHATPYLGMYDPAIAVPPPPNTPWPALTFNHGIALAGYMTQIARAHGDLLPMRFYVNDPWFCNSPWNDRWGRKPHDIYLTGAISRVLEDGRVQAFNDVKFLSIDTSWGELPEQTSAEVIPHILRATHFRPDAAPPVLWVYPVEAYHQYTFEDHARIGEVMAGDVLIQQAINTGLSLSGVVDADIFANMSEGDALRFSGSVLVSPVPLAGSRWSAALEAHLEAGGSVLLYGTAEHADENWKRMIGIETAEPISGELEILGIQEEDIYAEGGPAKTCLHLPALNGGGISEVASDSDPYGRVLASVEQAGVRRTAALVRHDPAWKGGGLAWVRGTTSVTLDGVRGRNLSIAEPTQYYPCEYLLRQALNRLGWSVNVERRSRSTESVQVMVSRNRNGFVFTGFSPDPDTVLYLRTPLGAPMLPERRVSLKDGAMRWAVWQWFHEECRVFVDQEAGEMSLMSIPAKHAQYRRRWLLTGLQDATVRFFPETGSLKHTSVLVNMDDRYCVLGEPCDSSWVETPWGRCLELRNITGTVSFAWSHDDVVAPVKGKTHKSLTS